MPSIKIIFSPRCLEYEEAGHPESASRVKNSWQYLKERGFAFLESEPANEKDLLAVHNPKLIEKIKLGNFFDLDTPNLPNIFEYACLSAGAAIKAAELALKNKKSFSLMRPPGHHAGRAELGGFCYFNNIAIAVEKIIKKAGKIAIVDFDCHHGQGTEEIFLNRDDVLYVSLHQKGIYPGTGLKSFKNSFNFSLAANTQSLEYLAVFNQGFEQVKKFQPNLIAVSAGFDGYKEDPIGGLKLELETFREIGHELSRFNLPLFAVLEGGYSPALPRCISNFLEGLS